MKREIEVIARGVCVKQGQILLCHTKGKANTYLPGGHVEFDEHAGAALEREIREELGVRSKAGRFLGVVEHAFGSGRKRTAEINLVFELEIAGLKSARHMASKEDYIEFQWVELSSLDGSCLEPCVLRKVLRGWLSRRADVSRWASTMSV